MLLETLVRRKVQVKNYRRWKLFRHLKYKKQAFPSPKPQLSLQQTLIFLYFLVCNLRAVLCYCYMPVTEHFGDTFDGNAVAERYCSGEGVACYVKVGREM